MEIGGFVFTIDEVDGVRIIEASYPPTVDVSKLSTVIAYYFDLWDEDVPTVSLVDLSRLSAFSEEVREVLKSVIQRTVLQPSFIGAAWYTRENRAIFDEIRRLRAEAGRPTDDVFETRDEALDFVGGLIAHWKLSRR
jgi:hypothetical protein